MNSLIGLSTYAYLWRMSDRVERPLSLHDVLRDAAGQGAELLQICDHEPLTAASDGELDSLRALADDLGVRLEVGTRGTRLAHLRRYLDVARRLDASLVRSMCTSGDDRPGADETVERLGAVMAAYEDAGVVLALETYEQVPTAVLVGIVERVGSSALGICLDPANCVANLEPPDDVVARCAPLTRSWHVKDFDFTRAPGWVGFQLAGVPIGTGRLDYPGIARALGVPDAPINRVIEFWLPWQAGDDAAATTVRTEAAWTSRTLEHLRSTPI